MGNKLPPIKFRTNAELDAYFDADEIECLECGRRFRNLGRHVRQHGMTPDEYRDKWGIPRGRGLAGRSTRRTLARQAGDMWQTGILNGKHLKDAARQIDYDARAGKQPASDAEQKRGVHRAKPWDSKKIPTGGKRRDGRDALRAREYQRAYRALKQGNSGLMDAYRKKYKEKYG